MKFKEIRVGIADLNVGENPDQLITVGLGSCVGIVIYDGYKKIGGLAHIMLPDSTQFLNVTNEMKFANLAIPILIDKLIYKGAIKRNLKAKIAGGASMFNFADKSMIMDIGNRNCIAVKKTLKESGIPIISEDIGGNKGRTVTFDTSNGLFKIRTVGVGVKEI
ncbi:chemotaxis protein CheD [Hathewaya histolytica]|uniref:chemotaxis protein CheD n=1 Tax=Hathewaya histolytica TaxID=1498 RepID=UPI003B670A54